MPGVQPEHALVFEVVADLADQGAHPEPVGHQRFDPGGPERAGGDRADRRGDDRLAEGVEQVVQPADPVGRAEQRLHGGGAGEGDRVDPSGADQVDKLEHPSGVLRQQPAVGRHGEHARARRPQPVELRLVGVAVQLDRDGGAGRVVPEHIVDEGTGGLLVAHPRVVEPGGPHRSAGLRAAHEDAGVLEGGGEVVAESRGIRRLEPATDAVGGRGQQHVRPGGDDQPGVLGEPGLVGGGGDADGRGVDDLRPASFERGDEVLGAPVAGHGDPEAVELVGAHPRKGRVTAHVADGVSGIVRAGGPLVRATQDRRVRRRSASARRPPCRPAGPSVRPRRTPAQPATGRRACRPPWRLRPGW